MASFSHPSTHFPSLSSPSYSKSKPHFPIKSPHLKKSSPHFLFIIKATTDNGGASGVVSSPAATVVPESAAAPSPPSAVAAAMKSEEVPAFPVTGEVEVFSGFADSRWVNGTWDLNQFKKNGSPDWDTVIDAEVKRRKWLEANPESSSNEHPVVFDTSIIPWWAWVKRFHLPEAELLNGRAAMVGFFMAYFVDSLTGVGLVDQMGNFFCKTLLFVAVAGVLLIRKNEDLDNLKKLIDESTFYDKQWQATWKDDTTSKK